MSGKLIIIESGSDASGKATQTKKLYERLLKDGYNVRKVEYPNYDSESSALVKMYLRGEFGEKATDVDPYIASTLLQIDIQHLIWYIKLLKWMKMKEIST